MVTRWTQIEEWYNSGEYEPYADINEGEILIKLLMSVKQDVFPWIRLNRIIRDIPTVENLCNGTNKIIVGGIDKVNLRQDIGEIFQNNPKLICNCIRCREVKTQKSDLSQAELCVREYESSDGIEYFISFESKDKNFFMDFLDLELIMIILIFSFLN